MKEKRLEKFYLYVVHNFMQVGNCGIIVFLNQAGPVFVVITYLLEVARTDKIADKEILNSSRWLSKLHEHKKRVTIEKY